jgi:outer membrane protein assembly factor BamD
MVRFWIGRILAASAVVMAVGLGGCADDTNKFKDEPVEQLYNEAVDHMMAGEWTAAGKAFDEVDRQHPYSVWATKAQLMSAYVAYEGNKFDDAITAADRFIQLHPGNRDTPYAYYIKAISYYEQIVDVGRDQRDTQNAMNALQDLVNRFPDSRYARDARLKLDLTRDHLAGKEMEIGRYYEKRELYVAAINRYKKVVNDYQTTTHVPEALARLSECYTALGLPDEATKDASVLGYNYPDNEWYQDTYDLMQGQRTGTGENPGWLSRTINGIL